MQLSVEHERELTDLVEAHSTPQKLAERARIVLLAAAGWALRRRRSNWVYGARQLVTGDVGGGMRRHPPGWRRLSDAPAAAYAGGFTPGDLPDHGWPAKTLRRSMSRSVIGVSELARQSVARGIVKSISHGSVGRF